MFYFRWAELETAMFASRFVITDLSPDLDPQSRALAVQEFFDRQRRRMELVGCAPPNDALIEAHFEELLNALKSLGGADRYLFGTRPSLADFAIYGQLTQLVLDPSPQSRVREVAPIIENWVCRLDDASGVEGEWQDEVYPATEPQLALLRMIGRSYLPFLAANAAAIETGHPGIRMIIDGRPFSQPVFKYQVKCYREILRRWSTLGEHNQNELSPVLSETGCLSHLRAQS
jgi:Glutathione S-transferase, C-terminal domain